MESPKKEEEINNSDMVEPGFRDYRFLECQDSLSYLPLNNKSRYYFSECEVVMPTHLFTEIVSASSYIDTPWSNYEFRFSEICCFCYKRISWNGFFRATS